VNVCSPEPDRDMCIAYWLLHEPNYLTINIQGGVTSKQTRTLKSNSTAWIADKPQMLTVQLFMSGQIVNRQTFGNEIRLRQLSWKCSCINYFKFDTM